MPIEFQCPRCQAPVTAADGDAGKKQRCPKCEGKLRVPLLPAPSSTAAAIEFLCPRCRTSLTVPADAAGKKQRCPNCQGKLRVPAPIAEGGKGHVTVEENNAALEHDAEEVPEGIPAMRAARRINLTGVLFPLACVGILAAVAAWLLHKPEPKLEGTLTGERLSDFEFGPFRLDNGFLGKPVWDAREAFRSLESEPIRAASAILTLEFQGSPAGIDVVIRTGDGSEFYRVDPRQDRHLANYLDKENDRFEAVRNDQLTAAVPEFLKAVEKRAESERDRPDLAEFRNAVGLAAICRGFGLQVQAAIDRQAYPCVHEDADGSLYFSLPLGTQEFELTGRENSPKASRNDAPFPGRYKVVVAKEPVTVNKEAPDPKKKVRKLLRE